MVRRSAMSRETLGWTPTAMDEEVAEKRSSGPDMNGEFGVVDIEPDVSDDRPDVNGTGPDMES